MVRVNTVKCFAGIKKDRPTKSLTRRHTWLCNYTHMCVPSKPIYVLGAHVILALLLIELAFLLCSCILVLLVLGYQVVHVAFGLGEFHLVHSFTCVPMQESLTTEHRGK